MNRSERITRFVISLLLAVILSFSFTAAAFADEGDLQYTTISGKVTDINGAGLAGVRVQLFSLNENAAQTAVFTDANGNWTTVGLDIIVGQTYLVNYYKRGWTFSWNNQSCMAELSGTVVASVQASLATDEESHLNHFSFTVDTVRRQATITGYNGNEEVLVIPAEYKGYTVTAIGNNVFKDKRLIRTAWLPESVTDIGSGAFSGCVLMAHLNLPNGLTHIGERVLWLREPFERDPARHP